MDLPRQFGEGVRAGGVRSAVELASELFGRGRRGREPKDATAGIAPGRGQAAHRCCLAGPGGGDRNLHAASGRRQLLHQRSLPRVQRRAVGESLQKGHADGVSVRDASADQAGRRDQTRLRVQDAS